MSQSYWYIDGIGIKINDIAEFIDNKKLSNMLGIDEEDVDFFGNYQDYSEKIDENYILDFSDDSDDNYYIYFAPRLPWQESKLKTEVEVKDYICKIVNKFTSDELTTEDISSKIDQVFAIGIG